jgi:hypothetical protein
MKAQFLIEMPTPRESKTRDLLCTTLETNA